MAENLTEQTHAFKPEQIAHVRAQFRLCDAARRLERAHAELEAAEREHREASEALDRMES